MKKLLEKNIKFKDKRIIIPAQSRVFILDYFDISEQSSSPDLSIFIGPQAQVEYLLIINTQQKDSLQIKRKIKLGIGAQVNSYQFYFGQGNYELDIASYLEAKANLKSQALFWQKQKQLLKVQDNYYLSGREAQGKFKVLGLVDDQAQAQYYSDLIVSSQGQLSNSRIDMNLNLLSSQARGSLLPGLKIAANNLQAGHSASTFYLSPDDLFYLQSRGLKSKEIKTLIIDCVTKRAIANLSNSDAKELVLNLIQKRQI